MRVEILSNVESRVVGLPKPLVQQIYEAFSVDVPGAQYSPLYKRGIWDGKRHFFSKLTFKFPTGLLRRMVRRLRRLTGTHPVVDDRRVGVVPKLEKVSAIALQGVKLRPYQLDAIASFTKVQRGIYWGATNSGKTTTAAALINALPSKYSVLYLVTKKILLKQAIGEISERMGILPDHIGTVMGGVFIVNRITVAVVNTVFKRLREPRVQKWLSQVKFLIGDEVHHAKSKMVGSVCRACNAPLRLGMSGTPFPDPHSRLAVESWFGPVFSRITNAELIKAGVSAVPTVEIVEYEPPEINKAWTWSRVYREGIVENANRNAVILDRAKRHAARGKQVLVLVAQIRHGDLLSSGLRTSGVSHALVHAKIPLSSIEEAKDRFQERKFSVLVATPVFDEGVSVPAIDVLIVADGGKSIRSVLQKVGRALRKKEGRANVVRIVDFADTAHAWLAEHSAERLSIYEKEKFAVIAA